jgi:TolB-like protein
MPESTTATFRFGGYELDLAKGTLRHGRESLFLRPKAYSILTHLAEHTGRVVPKSELMDAAWPGIFVTEDSLTQSIREIRKTLGENTIRTVSKRGYMLAVPTEEMPDLSRQPIIAVLRFRNDSGNPADQALVDGFAEDIINGLARFGTFTVLARNSSFSFASYEASEWQQIRARIGTDYVVEGSIDRQGERIVAAVSLADAVNGTQIAWWPGSTTPACCRRCASRSPALPLMNSYCAGLPCCATRPRAISRARKLYSWPPWRRTATMGSPAPIWRCRVSSLPNSGGPVRPCSPTRATLSSAAWRWRPTSPPAAGCSRSSDSICANMRRRSRTCGSA